MKYMLLIYSKESELTQEVWSQCTADSTAICHELAAQGKFVAASPLHPVATATSVRVRNGKPLITGGPFAETVEQLGGYYIIDVLDLDEAIAISSRLPPAKYGTVEIRPVMKLDGLPPDRQPSGDPLMGRTGTKYLLLCYDDEQAWNDAGQAAHQAALAEALELTHRLDTTGQYVSASPLHPVSTATSVRMRDGKRIVTDGPFAETREILGGYYLIYASDLNEAIQIAAQHSGARVGGVEIRPVYELSAIAPPHESEITSSRDLSFSREEVFNAFSNPQCLARWWGPAGFTNTFQQFDFRPGGEWRFIMHGPDGKNYENHSMFESIKPDRIVIDHVTSPRFRMTISLDDLPGGKTRLVWRSRFESAKIRNEIAKFAVDANEENFDRLTAELQSRPR